MQASSIQVVQDGECQPQEPQRSAEGGRSLPGSHIAGDPPQPARGGRPEGSAPSPVAVRVAVCEREREASLSHLAQLQLLILSAKLSPLAGELCYLSLGCGSTHLQAHASPDHHTQSTALAIATCVVT